MLKNGLQLVAGVTWKIRIITCLLHCCLSCRTPRFLPLFTDLKCITEKQMHMYTSVIENGNDLYCFNYD